MQLNQLTVGPIVGETTQNRVRIWGRGAAQVIDDPGVPPEFRPRAMLGFPQPEEDQHEEAMLYRRTDCADSPGGGDERPLRPRRSSIAFLPNPSIAGNASLARWRWRMCENYGTYDKRMPGSRRSWRNATSRWR